MSMSTKISDLPGPIPEDIRRDFNNIRQNDHNDPNDLDRRVQQNTIINSQSTGEIYSKNENVDIYRTIPEDSNVKVSIKKRVKFEDEVINSNIQDELNEENLLLFIILILASRNEMDTYIQQYLRLSDFYIVIVRCFILLIFYILSRRFLLSKN